MIPLDPAVHAGLGWRKATGFGFARGIEVQGLAAGEVARVAQSLPVAFRRDGGRWQALALLGPGNGVNVHVAADGRWRGAFVPARLRVYPFCLGADRRQLALWPDYVPEPLGQPGVLPFFQDGLLSLSLQKTRQFLVAVQEGVDAVHASLDLLHAHGALQPWSLAPPEVLAADAPAGLFRLDRPRFEALPDTLWLDLRRQGAIGWLHAHLESLVHADRLRRLAHEPAPAPAGPAGPPPPSGQVVDFLAAMAADRRRHAPAGDDDGA